MQNKMQCNNTFKLMSLTSIFYLRPENSEYCQGPNIKVDLCDDNKICNGRLNVTEYASEKCKQFSEIVTDVTGNGIQVSYNPGKYLTCKHEIKIFSNSL